MDRNNQHEHYSTCNMEILNWTTPMKVTLMNSALHKKKVLDEIYSNFERESEAIFNPSFSFLYQEEWLPLQ